LKLRSLLTAECFGHIFDDNLRNSGSQEFGVSAYRRISTVIVRLV